MIGASVEGELGCLGSLETGRRRSRRRARLRRQARKIAAADRSGRSTQFVDETKVDALAVAIGTSHGAYKFTRKPTGDVLAMDVIEKIHKLLPNTHIVMHGSSSVPEDWQAVFNEYGGEMKETYGVPVEEIVRGIKHGVRKINIDTDLRLAATATIRKILTTNKSEFDPRKYLKPARDAMMSVCKARLEAFGTAGQASKIKIIPMSDMAKRYASGELDPKTASPRRRRRDGRKATNCRAGAPSCSGLFWGAGNQLRSSASGSCRRPLITASA